MTLRSFNRILACTLSSLAVNFTFGQNIHFQELPNISPFEETFAGEAAHGDLDGDGDLDLIYTGRKTHAMCNYYLNDGQGNFALNTIPGIDSVLSSTIDLFDADGDSDLDVFISGINPSNDKIAKLYLNNGQGIFSLSINQPFIGIYNGDVVIFDADGDNDFDILATGNDSNNDRVITFYINDGNGSYSQVPTSISAVNSGCMDVSDIDGDGDTDLFIAGASDNGFEAKLYSNNGIGTFTEITTTSFTGFADGSVKFSDVDNDNDYDLILIGLNGISELYLNDGLGSFSNSLVVNNLPTLWTSSIELFDCDGDLDNDLIVIGSSPETVGSNNMLIPSVKFYINDGTGNYIEELNHSFIGSTAGDIDVFDIDNDGDLDIFITGNTHNQIIALMYENDGNGSFTRITEPSLIQLKYSSSAFGDIDGDSYEDIFIQGDIAAFNKTAGLYINQSGSGFHQDMRRQIEPKQSGDVLFVDVDGDSDLDLFTSGENQNFEYSTQLYKNDGSGSFTLDTLSIFEGMRYSDMDIGDIDSDGDPDLLIIGENQFSVAQTKLYLNNGNGTFYEFNIPSLQQVKDGAIKLLDIDGDMYLDLVLTGINNGNSLISELYLNDGNGNLQLVLGTPFQGTYRSDVAFADVDNDGDNDVFIAGANSPSALYLNDGSGSFTLSTVTTFPGLSRAIVRFEDLNDDGSLDLIISGRQGSVNIIKVYENDGQGNLSEVSGLPFEAVAFGDISFSDIDHDGDMDVILSGATNSSYPENFTRIYLNAHYVSIHENTQTLNILIHPNPFSDIVTIELNESIVSDVEINVIDNIGRSHLTKSISKPSQNNEILLDLKEIPAGAYFITIQYNNKYKTQLINKI